MRSLAAFLLFAISFTANAQVDYLVDWEAVGEEANGFLVDLVRIDSSNPPGNETRVAEYLQNVFAGEGIESEMFALDPDRANLVVRYRGNGSKRPILIMGHTDVVGVQAENWSENPFGGARNDGYIWGRGTLDDKDNVTAGLIVMLLLNRLDVEMDRDIDNLLSMFPRCQVSVFRCQDLAPRFPDTRNLTPETYKLRHGCPSGATFYERSIGKSIGA